MLAHTNHLARGMSRSKRLRVARSRRDANERGRGTRRTRSGDFRVEKKTPPRDASTRGKFGKEHAKDDDVRVFSACTVRSQNKTYFDSTDAREKIVVAPRLAALAEDPPARRLRLRARAPHPGNHTRALSHALLSLLGVQLDEVVDAQDGDRGFRGELNGLHLGQRGLGARRRSGCPSAPPSRGPARSRRGVSSAWSARRGGTRAASRRAPWNPSRRSPRAPSWDHQSASANSAMASCSRDPSVVASISRYTDSAASTAPPPATTFSLSSARFTMHSASCSDRSTSSSM